MKFGTQRCRMSQRSAPSLQRVSLTPRVSHRCRSGNLFVVKRLLAVLVIALVCACCSSAGSSKHALTAAGTATTTPAAVAQATAEHLCRAAAPRFPFIGTFLSARPGTVAAARQYSFGHGGFHLLTHAFADDADTDVVGRCVSQTPQAHAYEVYVVGPKVEVHVLGRVVDAVGPPVP
jgi:hypothetical protein